MNIRFCASYPEFSLLPRCERPEIAFLGRSNAGKSTALNALWEHTLARTSKTPGRTRLINVFESSHGQWVDLPGYGFAKMNKTEAARITHLLEQYLSRRDNLKELIWLMDIRHPLTLSDGHFLDFFLPLERPLYVLLAKADKLSKSAQLNTLRLVEKRLPGIPVQLFSANKRQGIDQLRQHIVSVLSDNGAENIANLDL